MHLKKHCIIIDANMCTGPCYLHVTKASFYVVSSLGDVVFSSINTEDDIRREHFLCQQSNYLRCSHVTLSLFIHLS